MESFLEKIICVHQGDVLLFFPFKEGSKYIRYDAASHRATLETDPEGAHEASYSNASRVTTYLRGAVEQFHGGLKGTFKVIFNRLQPGLSVLIIRFSMGCLQAFSSLLVNRRSSSITNCLIAIGLRSGQATALRTLFLSVQSASTTLDTLSFVVQHLKPFK